MMILFQSQTVKALYKTRKSDSLRKRHDVRNSDLALSKHLKLNKFVACIWALLTNAFHVTDGICTDFCKFHQIGLSQK